ncbi:MAG: RIP metalloprotease RseP [Candidatus Delongbacteria bacterium]|nr:RIP metalloprotease RseP [Candidatus Delongbacteria bacterium]MBN2835269.1 RIP metalloprotease RseP [Candidatus Delongbacteria bacterium]
MTTMLSFILVLGIIVFVHELGHFLAAKLTGMNVEVFSLGFGKSLVEYHRNGTTYKIGFLPLGGYVKITGMVDESLQNESDITGRDFEFESKSPLARLFVLSAGVMMNFLLAFTIYSVMIFTQGVSEVDGTKIGDFQEGYPAITSGLQIGDSIIKVNNNIITKWEQVSEIVHSSPNKEIKLTVDREGSELDFTMTSKSTETIIDGEKKEVGLLGISPALISKDVSIFTAVAKGAETTFFWIKMSIVTIKMLATGEAGVQDLGGPLMIAKMSGESAKQGFTTFLAFIAFISVNIGFLNILPIPMLDGGHMIYILAEVITRRKVSTKTKIKIQTFGMMFLFTLMIIVIYNDIGRLFG